MINIEKNVNLQKFNTLSIPVLAKFFCCVKNEEELKEALVWAKTKKKKIFILGGGSNVLFSKDFPGLVIKNEIRGINLKKSKDRVAFVEAMSGENWTKLVDFTVKAKLYGLENLFLIYGTVGAAPVQNIGAYGVELKDSFFSLRALDLNSLKEKTFFSKDCRFAYRDSVFKNKYKGRYFILSVTFKLSYRKHFNLSYKGISEELSKQGVKKPELKDLIKAITLIRNSKLPSPGTLPNAGSFFKNTEVSKTCFNSLKKKYPDMPSYAGERGKIKIPTAWLIEQAGWRGRKLGPVSMFEKQALIMVNHGGATAKDVLSLAKKVKAVVKKKFGLDICEEINII